MLHHGAFGLCASAFFTLALAFRALRRWLALGRSPGASSFDSRDIGCSYALPSRLNGERISFPPVADGGLLLVTGALAGSTTKNR
jgi:hypothetical protein